MNYLLLASTIALSLCWLLPGHYWPWMSFQQEFAAALGSFFLGAVALRSQRITWPPIAVLAACCALVPLLQWQLGLVRFASDAVLAASYLAGFGLCVAAGATLTETGRVDVARHLFLPLVIGAFVSVALALLQWAQVDAGFFVDSMRPGGRAYAQLGQPNNLASALSIAICATLLGHFRGLLKGWVVATLLAWFGLGLILTVSRTGYVFVLLLAAGLMLARRSARLNISPSSVLAALGVFVAAAFFWPVFSAAVDMNFGWSPIERAGTGSYRLIHWRVLTEALLQQPWFGYGWTQVALAQHVAMAHHPATGEVLGNSHNIVLDLLIWNGIPLGAAIVLAITWWFIRQFGSCNSPERFCLLAAVCALTLHGMLEFPLEYAYFLLPLGWMVGVLSASQTAAEGIGRVQRAAYRVTWIVLAGMTAWISVEYMKVEEAARTLRFVLLGVGIDKVNVAPEPEVLLLDRPRNVHRFMLAPARKDSDPGYMEWVSFMAKRSSTAPAMLRYALAAGLNGRKAEAESALINLCKQFKAGACDRARESWTELQAHHPELVGIAFPRVSEL